MNPPGKPHDQLIGLAKARMILKAPFFGSLMCHLNIIPADEKHPTETFTTDGINIWYNPKFVERCSLREICTGIAEAVLYGVLHHPTRRQHRTIEKYQTACRLEIDSILLKANADDLSGDGKKGIDPWGWPEDFPPLFDSELSKLVAEQIYHRLPDPPGKPQQPQPQSQPQPQPQTGSGDDGEESEDDGDGDGEGEGEDSEGDGEGEGKGDGEGEGSGSGSSPGISGLCTVIDSPLNNPAEIDQHESKWDIALDQAIAVAMAQGSLPSSIALLAKKAEPRIPWTYQLRTYMTQFSREDYSFKRPLMSAFAESDGDVILPSIFSEALGEVVVAVDTSGSIYCMKTLLDEFLGEIDFIHKICQPTKLHFVDCDATVYDWRSYDPSEEIDFSLRGGGGTDFRPVFSEIEARGIDPVCLIYFTDLEGAFPQNPPPYPVLWVDYGKRAKAPWGETLKPE